ncbi:MAG: Flp/Fap pilin component [Actinobacteria bacterium]|nr:Flp/Fap pilin component [Actinomycetota bacterium]
MLYVWSWMQTLGASLRHRDEGATMVEYGLLIAIIAVVVAAAAVLLAGAITGWFDDARNAA